MIIHVMPRQILAELKAGAFRTARDISWFLLDQLREDLQDDYGDSAANNMGLNIIENALDWSIGLFVMQILAAAPKGKIPKPFRIQIGKRGTLTAVFPSGKKFNFLSKPI